MGAETILDCVPNSKIITILRDGRDVLDSLYDARTSGGWLNKQRPDVVLAGKIPFLRRESLLWTTRMRFLMKVHENHPNELKHIVKYEDLRTNTLEELEKIYKFLDINVEKSEIEKIVNKYAFENVPEDQKGTGKSKRSATPGKWKENFNKEEQDLILNLIGSTLKQIGYE